MFVNAHSCSYCWENVTALLAYHCWDLCCGQSVVKIAPPSGGKRNLRALVALKLCLACFSSSSYLFPFPSCVLEVHLPSCLKTSDFLNHTWYCTTSFSTQILTSAADFWLWWPVLSLGVLCSTDSHDTLYHAYVLFNGLAAGPFLWLFLKDMRTIVQLCCSLSKVRKTQQQGFSYCRENIWMVQGPRCGFSSHLSDVSRHSVP